MIYRLCTQCSMIIIEDDDATLDEPRCKCARPVPGRYPIGFLGPMDLDKEMAIIDKERRYVEHNLNKLLKCES